MQSFALKSYRMMMMMMMLIDLIGYERRHTVVEAVQLVGANGWLERVRVCE